MLAQQREDGSSPLAGDDEGDTAATGAAACAFYLTSTRPFALER